MAAICVNCGRRFPETDPPPARPELHIPVSVLIVFGCLAVGLAAGILFALLSNVPALGGWLLVLLGVSMVVVMGAFEAGYMEGFRLWLQTQFKPVAGP
jgi:hypothetical protein